MEQIRKRSWNENKTGILTSQQRCLLPWAWWGGRTAGDLATHCLSPQGLKYTWASKSLLSIQSIMWILWWQTATSTSHKLSSHSFLLPVHHLSQNLVQEWVFPKAASLVRLQALVFRAAQPRFKQIFCCLFSSFPPYLGTSLKWALLGTYIAEL